MIKEITKESFEKYGWVIEFSECPEDPRFEVIVTEDENPWRIAMYRVIEKSCDKLESHPTSKESFEPISGTGLLLVAPKESPNQIEVFLLDRPICLEKGIWHQMITISEKTIVKITENLEVHSIFHSIEEYSAGLIKVKKAK